MAEFERRSEQAIAFTAMCGSEPGRDDSIELHQRLKHSARYIRQSEVAALEAIG